MFISNDSNNTINVNIDNIVLSPSSNIKILGVTIDERLTFNEHINIILSNAARQLNSIKHLQCNPDMESRLAIYKSYILSNFNYCPLVWHFCGIQNSRNMEKVQERTLRFVYEDYESMYDILLKKGNHDMLYIGRLRNMTTEIFKALHGSTPIYIIRDLFEEKDKIHNLHSTVSLKQPKCNTVTYGLNSFRYKGAKIWNDLPNKIKNSIT